MEIGKILNGETPSRFIYAPNYWQWFKHQSSHKLLPEEISHCNTLLDLYNYLGVDIFSRNIYSDPEKYWFGGICDEIFSDFEIFERRTLSGKDIIRSREYRSSGGILDEKLTYIYNESTLVQTKFLINDYVKDFELFRHFLWDRRWVVDSEKFNSISRTVGEKGLVIAGEFFSPLKMMHFTMGPVNTVYFLMEYPELAKEVVVLHEEAQLRCIEQTVKSGVKVIMSMDNLDTMFHPPDYVQEYSSSYYRRASEICHSNGAKFFIHACGQQRDNLRLISSYGVDGLEGVASPPLGDVTLKEAMKETRDDFIITGGISAMETRDLKSRDDIFDYVEKLFREMLLSGMHGWNSGI
ncbi:MAG: hypothetical protein IPJ37_20365 [Bacteroidales bacterium]|nr:hypothetical protein [Bacteroidales bacterium]